LKEDTLAVQEYRVKETDMTASLTAPLQENERLNYAIFFNLVKLFSLNLQNWSGQNQTNQTASTSPV